MNKNFYGFIVVILLYSGLCPRVYSQEYRYPVAFGPDEHGRSCLYVIHQTSLFPCHGKTSPTHLVLFAFDLKTGLSHNLLPSSFTPAGLKMLPDGSGFSFIDDGRLRIKLHAKRSPKVLDIYEPIYDLAIVDWIDANRGYLSAREGGNFGIFHVTSQADILRLVAEPDTDCMYPQKVGGTLFYVERSHHDKETRYAIVQVPYPEIPYVHHDFNDTARFEQRVEELLKNEYTPGNRKLYADVHAKKMVVDCGHQAVAFLRMVSDHEGFVVEHPVQIDHSESTIQFSYNHIQKGENGVWRTRRLFHFSAPVDLIVATGDEGGRLYESILPLLPRYHAGVVFFVDCAASSVGTLNLFSYVLSTGVVRQHTFDEKPGAHVFVPLVVADTLYCGGVVPGENGPLVADAGEFGKLRQLPVQ